MPDQRVARVDFIEIDPAKVVPDHQGLRITGAVFARSGVLIYEQADGTILRELRRPEDMRSPEVLETYQLLPVTNGHPIDGVNLDNAAYLEVGSTGDKVWADECSESLVLARGSMAIRRRAAVDAVNAGRRQLSHGYWAVIIEESGEFHGEPYDQIQVPVAGDHMALVDLARAGAVTEFSVDSAGRRGWRADAAVARQMTSALEITPEDVHPCADILSSADTLSVDGKQENALEGQAMPKTKLRIDGVPREVEDDDVALVEQLLKERDDARDARDAEKTRADGAVSKVDAAEAERDGFKVKYEDAQAKLVVFETEKVDGELVALKERVKPVLGDLSLDGLDALAIKRQVAKAAFDGRIEGLDAKAEAAIEVLFDMAMADVQAGAGGTERLNDATAPTSATPTGDRADTARAKWDSLHNRNAAATPKG